jgi:hypothetical protein
LFDMFLNVVYVKGIIDMSAGREASWKHCPEGHAEESREEVAAGSRAP